MREARKRTSKLPEELHPDRRSAQRCRVLKGAIIRFNHGYGALECVARNLSDGGARLAFGETAAVPSAFDLKLAGDGTVRAAKVCWRTPEAVGVSFM